MHLLWPAFFVKSTQFKGKDAFRDQDSTIVEGWCHCRMELGEESWCGGVFLKAWSSNSHRKVSGPSPGSTKSNLLGMGPGNLHLAGSPVTVSLQLCSWNGKNCALGTWSRPHIVGT